MGDALPWQKMHEVLIDCGSHREYARFCKRILNQMDQVIPYDQARLYFVDDKGRVYDEYLIEVEKRWSREYREYYSTVENGRYAITSKKSATIGVHDWSAKASDEFLTDHLRPQGIRHSLGFGLLDANHSVKAVFAFDRTSSIQYSPREIEIMGYMFPQLNNLHQIFYVDVPGRGSGGGSLPPYPALTAREAEIAELLRRGVSPVHIGEKLCISFTTVKKHIANMHAKLHVTTRQELIVKLLQAG